MISGEGRNSNNTFSSDEDAIGNVSDIVINPVDVISTD